MNPAKRKKLYRAELKKQAEQSVQQQVQTVIEETVKQEKVVLAEPTPTAVQVTTEPVSSILKKKKASTTEP